MTFLSVNNVFKRYPSQESHALENISLQLKKGEVLAIVGENGSGKTTLLRLINGMEDADKGEIVFNNDRVSGPSSNLVPGHQQIKMLFQEFNLFPKHTIKENIGYNLRSYKENVQEEKISELIKLCRLEGMENKLPAELSGGQQQRVALAKAIADDPLLLLMDEPFSNLDLFLRDEIKKKVVQRIKEEGNSAILVTHDVKDALALGDRIGVLRNGNMLQLDTPKNVYEKPADEYVAYLFGKVNILKANDFFKSFPFPENKKLTSFKNESKVCIRPEHVLICKEEKSQCKGKVKNVMYLGDSFELEIQLKNIIIRANTRKKKINTGDDIFLRVSPGRIHLMK
ncbi:MAG: ABC transporter ATP-binding protein [Cytophagaceae bacterium]|nr:ABC transporter ATP-binding protein [Cytophagaceae bacterium]